MRTKFTSIPSAKLKYGMSTNQIRLFYRTIKSLGTLRLQKYGEKYFLKLKFESIKMLRGSAKSVKLVRK